MIPLFIIKYNYGLGSAKPIHIFSRPYQFIKLTDKITANFGQFLFAILLFFCILGKKNNFCLNFYKYNPINNI